METSLKVKVFSFVSCCFDKTVNTPIGERKNLLYLIIKGSQGSSLRHKKPGGKNWRISQRGTLLPGCFSGLLSCSIYDIRLPVQEWYYPPQWSGLSYKNQLLIKCPTNMSTDQSDGSSFLAEGFFPQVCQVSNWNYESKHHKFT